jgi:lysophospholipase L1-like esterase
VLIAARGGDETIHTLPRLAADCTSWRARYAIIGLGTNDSGPQIWQPNMATMIAACEAAGIEPVLVTYPPYAAAQDRINGYNAVVLSGALGRRRVIDIAAAVTVGGDRVTPIAGYFNADNLHLTVAGHRAVWVWILANAPTCWTVPAQMHSRAGWCPNCGARSSRLRA